MPTVEVLRDQLEAEQNRIRSEIEDLNRRLEVKPDYSLGAGDPAVYQWEFNLAMRNRARDALQEIEEALERIAGHNYGCCSKCGKDIEPERLEVLPATTLCAVCAQTRR
jgi:RNA polymerase-binding transcription factor